MVTDVEVIMMMAYGTIIQELARSLSGHRIVLMGHSRQGHCYDTNYNTDEGHQGAMQYY